MGKVLMPRLSDSMETGTVAAWLVTEGDHVERGAGLAEIETDKATIVVEAEESGRIHITIAVGVDVAVGTAIAEIMDSERYASADGRIGEDSVPSNDDPIPELRPASREPHPRPGGPGRKRTRQRASPVARKVALERGIDLAGIAGSGPKGRVLKTDVIRADRPQKTASPPSSVTRMHETVARRMTIAKQSIPHFYLSIDVDVTDANHLRKQLSGIRISITDLVVHAVAVALSRLPAVNTSWSDDGLVANSGVNIGIAVALEDGGLLVPVIGDAQTLSLTETSATIRGLVERARRGSLAVSDIRPGTFTVSNLGMLGIREFHAIINPPESGILAVGSVVRTPRVGDSNAIVIRDMVTMSLSADHRVYTGATGAGFLGLVRELLEAPLELFAGSAAIPGSEGSRQDLA